VEAKRQRLEEIQKQEIIAREALLRFDLRAEIEAEIKKEVFLAGNLALAFLADFLRVILEMRLRHTIS